MAKNIWNAREEDIEQIAEIQNQTSYDGLLKEGLSLEEASNIGFHLIPFSIKKLHEIRNIPNTIFLAYGNLEKKGGVEAHAFGFPKEEVPLIVPRFVNDIILDSEAFDPRNENYFFFRQIAKRRELVSLGPVYLEKAIIERAFQKGYSSVCGEISIDPLNKRGLKFHERVGNFKRFGEVFVGGSSKYSHFKLGCYYTTPELYQRR